MMRRFKTDLDFMQQVLRAVLDRTIPIAWFDPYNIKETVTVASCFIIRFPHRLIGVTAHHVYESYMNAKWEAERSGKELWLQLKNFPIDLERITSDKLLDICTFTVTEEQLQGIGDKTFDCAGLWPPPEPEVGAHFCLCGFPNMLFEIDDGTGRAKPTSAFGAFVTLNKITSDRLKFKRGTSLGVPDIPMPPEGANFSGTSGGPAVLPVIYNDGTKEVTKIIPAGVIVRGSDKDEKEDDPTYHTQTFLWETIFVAPIGAMTEEGYIDLPWLPGT